MATPFGPQLIGQTEKTLNVLLRQCLEGTDLNEPQWVTLQVARLDGTASATELASRVADRAHFPDAADLVADLDERGLLDDGQLTGAGRALISAVQGKISTQAAPIWDNLAPDDVAAAGRVLNEVLARARAVVG